MLIKDSHLGEYPELKRTVITLGSMACILASLPFAFSVISSLIFPKETTYQLITIIGKDKLGRTLIDPETYKIFFHLGTDTQEISVDAKQYVNFKKSEKVCIEVNRIEKKPIDFRLANKNKCK